MKVALVWSAIILAIACDWCQADLVVGTDGTVTEGKVLAQDDAAVSFALAGPRARGPSPTSQPAQRIDREKIARVILTDEHGGVVGGAAATTRPASAWGLPPEPPAPPVGPAPSGTTYYVIPLRGEIGEAITAKLLEKSLADAQARKPAVVVLDIDSPGGSTAETEKILLVLHRYNKRMRIVALTGKCLSAAAVMALSAKEIYVKPSSTIGAATAYKVAPSGLPAAVEEKLQSAWRAIARNSAEEGGHEPLLAEAMIDSSVELHLESVNGRPAAKPGPGEKTLCPKGKLLTLTSHEAVKCGLAAGDAEDYAELGRCLKMADWKPLAGLAGPLAEYQAKRVAALSDQLEKIASQIRGHYRQAVDAAPFAGIYLNRITTVVPQPQQPGFNPSPAWGAPSIFGPGPTPGFPGGGRPGMFPPGRPSPYPQPPYGPQPGRTISSRTVEVVPPETQAMWWAKSLVCVAALQQVEQDLAEAAAVCQAADEPEGHEFFIRLRQAVGEARASVYDERLKYAGSTRIATSGRDPSGGSVGYPRSPGDERLPAPLQRKPVPNEIYFYLGKGVSMTLVPIPAGKFRMGSPDTDRQALPSEKPQHEVKIPKPFFMSVYPVTKEQYAAVAAPSLEFTHGQDAARAIAYGDAFEFCRKLSKMTGRVVRLPTEEEWEYACRAGSTSQYYWGDDFGEKGNIHQDTDGMTVLLVGQRPPNAWGLYDMHGCVWQWCSGEFGPYPGQTDQGFPKSSGRVRHILRGGTFHDLPSRLRDASRNFSDSPRATNSYGFRVVAEAD